MSSEYGIQVHLVKFNAVVELFFFNVPFLIGFSEAELLKNQSAQVCVKCLLVVWLFVVT